MPDLTDEEIQQFASRLVGKGTKLTADQQKKLREAFARIVTAPAPRVIVPVQMQASTPVARVEAPQQAQPAPLIPGIGHLSRAIDAHADPMPQVAVGGTGPLIPGVGHLSQAIDAKIDPEANARTDAALAEQAKRVVANIQRR